MAGIAGGLSTRPLPLRASLMPVLGQGMVLLAPRVALAFAAPVRQALEQAVRDGRAVPNELWGALDDMETAGNLVGGPCRDKGAVDKVRHDGVMVSVRDAAAIEGCSKSAITERIRRGTLPAERDAGGRYLIRRENLKGGLR